MKGKNGIISVILLILVVFYAGSGAFAEKVDTLGINSDIRDIAVQGTRQFLVTDGGLLVRKEGFPWQQVPARRDVMGMVAAGGEHMLAWSPVKLFEVAGERWKRIGEGAPWDTIDDVAYSDGFIYVVSGGDVYRSRDEARTWKKIFTTASSGEWENSELYTGEDIEIEEKVYPVIRGIDVHTPGIVTIATSKGVVILREDTNERKTVDTTGLPSARVIAAVNTPMGLFTATESRVFLYEAEEGRWRSVIDKRGPGKITLLRKADDSEGHPWLWVVAGKEIIRHDLRQVETKSTASLPLKVLREPSIIEVHKMAVDYAEVSPEKISTWRRGARWKAFFPRLSVSFSEATDDNIEIYKSATKTYVVEGPKEKGHDWGIDLTWDLSNIIWNSAQTSIDVRSKLMVQLRDDILEEVTRLYFERKRLLAEAAILEERTGDDKGVLEKRLRIEELTAYIDAFTGGRYSASIEGEKTSI